MWQATSLFRPLRSHLVAGMATQGTRGRELSSTAASRAPIKNVAVIGSGLMGSGIAQVREGLILKERCCSSELYSDLPFRDC